MNPQPKPKPRALEKAEADAKWKKRDREESEKVKIRSGGRCEVRVAGVRCNRIIGGTGLLAGIHHHIGGWKLRGRGDSALAKNKTHACHDCHRLITGNVLEHIAGNRYRRVA